MTNDELIAAIRNEIERQMKFYDEKEMKAWDGSERGDEDALWYQGHRKMCEKLLSFLSTLEPEKPVPADLEEAAWDCVLDSVDVNNPVLLPKYKELLTYLFIAGAKWDRSQMLKEAVEGEVENASLGIVYLRKNLVNEGHSTGNKVRIIILPKED